MQTIEELRQQTNAAATRARAAVRRMVVKITKAAIWQITGFRLLDGSTETRNAEHFGGIGIAARPPGDAEAIVLMVGDADAPVIVAVRDEATRRKIAAALKIDETMIFNSKSCVHVKDDGTIEARSASGTAQALATKADVVALANFVQGLFVGGSGSAVIPPGSVPQPAGTSKLKGE
jgi:phage gp45-like